MSNDHSVVAIIPAYNERATIQQVVMRTRKHVSKVIVCDDGSTDGTGDIAEASGAIVVRHRENMGYGAAISTLFEEARGLKPDVVVSMDADGQHDPRYIPRLVEQIMKNGTDLVIGSRFLSNAAKNNVPAYRKVGINILTKLTNTLAHSAVTDAQSGFRAYSWKALQVIRPNEKGYASCNEILVKARRANLKIEEMPMTMYYEGGTSKHNPVAHSIEVMLSALKFASIRRPQIFYGVPAVAALVVGLGFWIRASLEYSMTGQLWTDMTFIALGATVISLIFSVVALILWALLSVVREALTSEE